MAAALVIKIAEESEHNGESLSIYAEESNRQMLNLDLINIVNYVAVHRVIDKIMLKALLNWQFHCITRVWVFPHGTFWDYQVDAITLEISSRVSPINMVRHKEFLLRGGRFSFGRYI